MQTSVFVGQIKMFERVLIDLIFFCIICNQRVTICCENTENLVEHLNALLSSPGWGQIGDARVRYEQDTIETKLISGKDLFIPIEKPELFYVSVENFDEKYPMIVQLLGCVYANEVLRFMNLIKTILNESSIEKKRINNTVNKNKQIEECRKTPYAKDKVIKPYNKPTPSYDRYWGIFKCALSEFEKSHEMFVHMYNVLLHLSKSLANFLSTQTSLIIQPVLSILFRLKESTFNETVLLLEFRNVYHDKDITNTGKLGRRIHDLFNTELKRLVPFTENCCVLPDNQNEDELLQVRSLRTGNDNKFCFVETVCIKIQNHITNAIKNYILDLGLNDVGMLDTAFEEIQDKHILVDKLNALLSYSGWKAINDLSVKYQDETKKNFSFSGSDLFLPIEADNVVQKLFMTTQLIGCVYTNAILKFISLITYMAKECTYEAQRYYDSIHNLIRSQKAKKAKDVNYNAEVSHNYRYWEVFNYTLNKFKYGLPMFECMHEALFCLAEKLKQLGDTQTYQYIVKVLSSMITFKEYITDLKPFLPEYNVDYPHNDITKVKEFNKTLRAFLNFQKTYQLAPFIEKYCILPEINLHTYDSERTRLITNNHNCNIINAYGLQIQEHLAYVTKHYFLDLGFKSEKYHQNIYDTKEYDVLN